MRTNTIRGARYAAIPLLALLGVLLVALEGGRGLELYSRVSLSQQSYPFLGVVFFATVIAIESLVLWIILRPRSYDRSWLRAIVALLVVAGLWFCWPLLVDGPRFYDAHVRWLAMVAVLLLFLGIVSFASAMARRITDRSTRRATRAG